MGALLSHHSLTWVMNLSEHGYTVLELRDEQGRRWGWIVNTPLRGWTAHVGSFGQAVLPISFAQLAMVVESLSEAKGWVEEEVAVVWRDHYTTRSRIRDMDPPGCNEHYRHPQPYVCHKCDLIDLERGNDEARKEETDVTSTAQ